MCDHDATDPNGEYEHTHVYLRLFIQLLKNSYIESSYQYKIE